MTINAEPPSTEWPYGRHDSVIVNTNPQVQWPNGGLEGISFINLYGNYLISVTIGHIVADLRLIFRLVPPVPAIGVNTTPVFNATDRFLAYVTRYDIIPQFDASTNSRGSIPDPVTSLYSLKKATRTNGELIGDVIPLQQLRALIDVVPQMGLEADRRLTKENSTTFSSQFWLNKYFDKDTFYALTLQ